MMKRIQLTFLLSAYSLLIFAQYKENDAQTWYRLDKENQEKPLTTEVIESTLYSYKLKVKINGLGGHIIKNDYGTFYEISLGNMPHLLNFGEPSLPVIPQLVSIPDGARLSASISGDKWESVHVGKLYPTQKPVSENCLTSAFEINEKAYEGDYTPETVKIGREMEWRGLRCTGLTICPFKYSPAKGELSVLTEFVLQIDFDLPKMLRTGNDCRMVADEYKLFNNGIPASSEAQKRAMTRSSWGDNYDLLIIVGNNNILNSNALKRFRMWKAFMGYKSKAVSISSIGYSCNAIRSYIYSQYYNKYVMDVLFIGDSDQIPLASHQATTYQGPGLLKSDYWYGCLGGDEDVMAELPIGRFSTNTVNEFENMVNKTIYYEGSYDYTNKVLLMSHWNEIFQLSCDSISDFPYTYSVSFVKAYGALPQYNGTGARNDTVTSHINNGVHIVTYKGHGMYNSFGNPGWNDYGESYTAAQLNSMDSDARSIFFSLSCLTGNIHNLTCMLESYTRAANGAIAFLGATEEVNNTANGGYSKILFERLFKYYIYNLGSLNYTSHLYNFAAYSDYAIDLAFCYICGGDPTLAIWTSVPQTLSVADITVGWGNFFIIPNVGGISEASVVTEDGEMYDHENSGYNGCLLSMPSENCFIAINNHNYYPYIVYYDATEETLTPVSNSSFIYSIPNMQMASRVAMQEGKNATFDLMGRKQNTIPPQGLYINNGKISFKK